MALIDDLQSKFLESKEEWEKKSKEIDLQKTEAEMEDAWYSFIKDFFEKIEKTNKSCDEINNILKDFKTKAGEASSQIKLLSDGEKGSEPGSKHLVDKGSSALNSVVAWESIEVSDDKVKKTLNIKDTIEKIKSETFKNSEVKKRADAVFSLLDEIKKESEKAFEMAVKLHGEIFTFHNAIDNEKHGLPACIEKMSADSEAIKKSYADKDGYLDTTTKDWNNAKRDKTKRDNLVAERDRAKILMDSYEKAITAITEAEKMTV